MKFLSWLKIAAILGTLALVHAFAPPVETTINNKMALQQLNGGDAGYVSWTAWNSSPDKSGLLYGLTLICGLLIMYPEIKAGVAKLKGD